MKFHHSSTIVLDYNRMMVYVIAPNGTASRTPTTETSTACAHLKGLEMASHIDYIFPRWGIYNLCLNNVTSVKQTKNGKFTKCKNFLTQKWAHKNECFPANSPE